MFGLLKLVRVFIGGKTELGLVVSFGALIVYLLPIAPGFGVVQLIALYKVVAMLTGVALLSKIEDKEGFLNAIKSMFGPWRKS